MPATVLIVDDEESIRNFVSMALEDEGYKVVDAPNGEIALDVIDHYHPKLVLLDMRMPVMDGWAFLDRFCKRDEPRPPVIAVSANTINLDTLECASGFLAKPFDLNKLLSVVEQYAR